MFEQMEESADRCWAYNKSGQRCEMIAGHDRDHNVVIAWTNDECWVPGTEFTRIITAATPDPQPVDEPVYVGSGMCGICEHPHHPDGPCGADDDGFPCDCRTSIED